MILKLDFTTLISEYHANTISNNKTQRGKELWFPVAVINK